MIGFDSHFSWTLFFYLDRVINKIKYNGFITSVEEFLFLPFVKLGLKSLLKQFSRIISVTNQQSVGKAMQIMIWNLE